MPDGIKIQNNKVVQNQTCQSYTAGYDYFFCSDNKFCAVNLQQGSVKVVKEFDHNIQDFDIEQFNGKVALCFRGQQGMQLWQLCPEFAQAITEHVELSRDIDVEAMQQKVTQNQRTKQLLSYIHQGRSVKQFRADEKLIKKSD